MTSRASSGWPDVDPNFTAECGGAAAAREPAAGAGRRARLRFDCGREAPIKSATPSPSGPVQRLREILEKLGGIQSTDLVLPLADVPGRELVSRVFWHFRNGAQGGEPAYLLELLLSDDHRAEHLEEKTHSECQCE